MEESSQETDTQQVNVLAPAVYSDDHKEAALVSTSSTAEVHVSSSTSTDQKEVVTGDDRVEVAVAEDAPSVESLPACSQPAAQEQASTDAGEEVRTDESEPVASSSDHIQEETLRESCDSQHQVVDGSVVTQAVDDSMHENQEVDRTPCLSEGKTEAECRIDIEINDPNTILSLCSEHSEPLDEEDEMPSTPEIVPIEVGVSPRKPPEPMETDHSNKKMEDSNSSQDITGATGDTQELEAQPKDPCRPTEQTGSNVELPAEEPNRVFPSDSLAKEEDSSSLPVNQVQSVPTAVAVESITSALINEDTNSSQDFVKDDGVPVKPLATLDAATDASGRSTPNVELLKDLTGRDSPSIRSLKEGSGRDSPSQRSRRRIGRDSVVTEANEANMGIFPAENLFEYQWPQEKGAEWYFVQEQISEFLQVKSFKRKYPDLERRVMDIHEKDFLRERGVVTEEQVTLGLTALRADEVYDLMLKDAPDKSAEYARVLHEKEKQNISNKHKQYEAPSVDSNKVQEYVRKAVRQAADYNSALMAERREERQYYFDMQTLTVQMPASRMKRQDKEATKLGPYPVAVIPGQYQNYYRSYSSEELKYFPLNTSLYGPMAPRRQTDLAPPQAREEPELLSDNDTVLSTENFDSSSDTSERDQPTPMDIVPSSIEPVGGDDATVNITLPTEQSSSGYKPVAVQELDPCAVVGLERPKDIPDAICGLCLKDSSQNKMGVPEKMIHCSQCDNSGHPSCLDMTLSMVEVIQTYPWQCMECKTCFHCGDPTHEDKMMFCDMCDRGYHTFCVGLQDIPTGLWACESCQTSDLPATLEPHVPTPPLPPTPPPAEPSLIEEPPPPPAAESTPTNKKKGRRSATPVPMSKQSTPGAKRAKASTPTPKRVRKK